MQSAFKRCFLLAIICLIFLSPADAAQQGETERLIQTITPPITVVERRIEKKDEIMIDSFYEASDILQGSRTGKWTELTNRLGYTHQNIHSYVSVSELERFGGKDYTANIGSYFNLQDSYLHAELGFGWRIDYIYKFISITEYGHRLYKDMYWQMGYSYRAYGTDDVHLVYPGLIYYFGNSYMGLDGGVNYTEGHDTAYFGTARGNFAITDFLNCWGGISVGEKLYDINELDAGEEFGYVLFIGLTYNIYKGISARVGYSYGQEAPKFIKRSVNFGLTVKI